MIFKVPSNVSYSTIPQNLYTTTFKQTIPKYAESPTPEKKLVGETDSLRSKEIIRCLHMDRVSSCLEDCQKQQKSPSVFASGFADIQTLGSQFCCLKTYDGVAGGRALLGETDIFPLHFPNPASSQQQDTKCHAFK